MFDGEGDSTAVQKLEVGKALPEWSTRFESKLLRHCRIRTSFLHAGRMPVAYFRVTWRLCARAVFDLLVQ